MAIKVFTLGNYGFVSRAVGDAIGLAPHVTQARVLVAAGSKAAAFALLTERGMAPFSIRSPAFRTASGRDVDQLTAEGLLSEPTVLVTKEIPSGPVVRIDADRSIVQVSTISR